MKDIVGKSERLTALCSRAQARRLPYSALLGKSGVPAPGNGLSGQRVLTEIDFLQSEPPSTRALLGALPRPSSRRLQRRIAILSYR